MKEPTAEELAEILCNHYLWLAELGGYEANLRGRDLAGKSFRYADLRRVDFRGANLSKADLTGAILCEANLEGADLMDAMLTNANLEDASLANADLSGAYLAGAILSDTALRPRVFLATKLEEYRSGSEAAEARECLKRLKTDKLDALQLHNVRDPQQDMSGLNALKAQGICRYTGITTTYKGAYAAAESILKRTRPDFLEIDYAIDNRDAEERLVPAAADAGAAVLVALPFGRGRLFRKALGTRLPDWAADIDCTSWAQFFLKFILSYPAVTTIIPGTDKAEHLVDNLAAGRGRLPDAKERARMVQYVASLG